MSGNCSKENRQHSLLKLETFGVKYESEDENEQNMRRGHVSKKVSPKWIHVFLISKIIFFQNFIL